MFKMVFSVLWTVGTFYLVTQTTGDAQPWERSLSFALPLFGLLAGWVSYTHWRRRRSLRTEVENGATIYIWTELGGRECRSTQDPRPDWDADDDGDGDGGD